MITVNYGAGLQWNSTKTKLVAPSSGASPNEAAAWVAYANGNPNLFGTPQDISLGTDAQGNNWKTVGYWAKLRALNLKSIHFLGHGGGRV